MNFLTHNPEVVSAKGGSEADQRALLALHHGFLEANDVLDYDHLCRIWSADPDAIHFNTNGYSYDGLADWENIWNFYRPRFKLNAPYGPGKVRIFVSGDMGYVVADSVARHKDWIGEGEILHNPPHFRSTQVCVREQDGVWRVLHAHFSVQEDGVRVDTQE